MSILIDNNPALTKIARIELYAAIDTLRHDLSLYDREQKAYIKFLESMHKKDESKKAKKAK